MSDNFSSSHRAVEIRYVGTDKRLEVDFEDGRGFSYPAALSLTRYLESRRGFGGLLVFLENLAEGLDTDAALEDAYGEDYRTLCVRWAEDLQREERG